MQRLGRGLMGRGTTRHSRWFRLMISQESDGHSVIKLGRVTPHNLVLEDFWCQQDKRMAPSREIMMKHVWYSQPILGDLAAMLEKRWEGFDERE